VIHKAGILDSGLLLATAGGLLIGRTQSQGTCSFFSLFTVHTNGPLSRPGGDTRIFGHAAFRQIICRLEARPNSFDEISPRRRLSNTDSHDAHLDYVRIDYPGLSCGGTNRNTVPLGELGQSCLLRPLAVHERCCTRRPDTKSRPYLSGRSLGRNEAALADE
jgi:hypothetical protein